MQYQINEPWLVAKEIEYSVDNKLLIDKISLSIHSSEFIAILGANGAGKSTLMRLLTGFLQPSNGHISIQGQNISSYSADKLACLRAVMQQQIIITTDFTVYEVILLAKAQEPTATSKKHLDEIIQLTECHKLLNRKITHLSGGELQRVHLARTLFQIWEYTERGVAIFLDEPTSALDLYYQQHLLRILKHLTIQKRIAIFAILHDVNLAALYADRMCVLQQGRLIIDDTPNSVLNHPDFLNWFRIDGGIMTHPTLNQLPQIYLNP